MILEMRKTTIFAATLAASQVLAMGANALDNPCTLSNPRDSLIAQLTPKLIGQRTDIGPDVFGKSWKYRGENIPDFLFTPEGKMVKNSEHISQILYQISCKDGNNNKREFYALMEGIDGIISGLDIEIVYKDRNFPSRKENLHWRNYDSSDDLLMAAQSVFEIGSDNSEKWKSVAERGGFIQLPSCKNNGHTYMPIIAPQIPTDSLFHKFGANNNPNSKKGITGIFDDMGIIMEVVKGTHC